MMTTQGATCCDWSFDGQRFALALLIEFREVCRFSFLTFFRSFREGVPRILRRHCCFGRDAGHACRACSTFFQANPLHQARARGKEKNSKLKSEGIMESYKIS